MTSATLALRHQGIQIRQGAPGLVTQGAMARGHFGQGEVIGLGLWGLNRRSLNPRQGAFNSFDRGKRPVIAHGYRA